MNRPPAFFRLLQVFESWMQSKSTIPDEPYIDAVHFPWTKWLEQNASDIFREYLELKKSGEPIPPFQEVSKEQAAITNDNRWQTFLLYAYGAKSVRNTTLCPATTRALEAIPEMRTAFFSILAPGKIIPPHRGPYKGLVRCHLALKIPEGDCGLMVSGQSRTWINGKCLFFDDTLIHEAWNKTNEERVVLFLDILRPLKKPYGKWNDRIIYWIASSYYGKKSIRTFSDWYARHGIRNDVVI
jgi:aspartyl/asparaginyl beta-hydroxylase (cupin superfamily)